MNTIVKINKTELQVLEYEGQRVVTLAQMDDVHERPDGTAGRNYREHKHRLVEGADFCKVGADEFRRHLDPSHSKFASEDVVLITEQGYLMLVKSFTDDLAWQVQRDLVSGYFRGKSLAVTASPVKTKPAPASLPYREAASIARDCLKMFKLLGLDDGMAKVVTAKHVRQATGLDFTPLLTAATATQNPHVPVKEISEAMGSAVKSAMVNTALEMAGFQVKERWTNRDGDPRSRWALTEAGKEFGALAPYQAEGGEHSGYRPVWLLSVIDVIRPMVDAAVTQRNTKVKKPNTKIELVAA